MALNCQKTLIDAIWTQLDARSVLVAAVGAGNRLDSSETSDPQLVRDGSRSLPADLPALRVRGTGGVADEPVKVFQSETPGLDYTVPLTVTFDIELISDDIDDATEMPLEAEVEAVLHGFMIALCTAGYRWVGPVKWRKARGLKPFGNNKVRRLVATYSVTVSCRPKKSALTA